jgi:putative nucleotidyltransferase with HDIG domain
MVSDLNPRAGQWVASVGEQIASAANTPAEAARLAAQRQPGKAFRLRFAEPENGEPLSFPPVLSQLQPFITEQSQPVYLVGGGVRDALLGRTELNDFDFIVPEKAINLAFRIANHLDLPAYVLDQDRDIARIILPEERITLDFAGYRGEDLTADLRDRDFTINAMALPAGAKRRSSLSDPCRGLVDLQAGLIRQTHDNSISDDPVRAIRAVRLALSLNFTLTADTEKAITSSSGRLLAVSTERQRDELLKLMLLPVASKAISETSRLGLLDVLIPEIAALSSIEQSAPHHEPVLAHTVSVLRWLCQIEGIIFKGSSPLDGALDEIQTTLGKYQHRIRIHLDRQFDGILDGRLLLRLGALFHDVGKGQSQTVSVEGRIQFLGHAHLGATISAGRLRQLCFSAKGIAYIQRIVANHMRPMFLAASVAAKAPSRHPISRRAVYRFFRDAGLAGIDVCLLSLADHLATHDGPGDPNGWRRHLQVVAELLHHYFDRHNDAVAPTPLINGRELMDSLNIKPGPEVGRLLQLIEESQAAGELSNRAEAIEFARSNHLQRDRN